MKFKLYLVAIVLFGLSSCGFNQSAKIDLTTGLSTKGNGLSSSEVYLSINDEKISRNTFTYGEMFHLNFRNVSGFKKENGNVFPGMEIVIIGTAGDTAMYYADMYADKTDGIDVSPLFLYTNVTVAKPMNSTKDYTLYVNIWDKKGTGTFKAEMDFNVIADENIKVVKSEGVSYNDIYLFSSTEKTLMATKIKLNEKYYMIFEGIKGFKAEEGKVKVGMSVNATDANGAVVINAEDLFGDEEFDEKDLTEQISTNVVFTDANVVNPILCKVVIWDKKSDAKITASVDFEVK
jgi:hypothetical protein